MIRYFMQFNTNADVLRRTVLLVLIVAISAGVILASIGNHYFDNNAQGFLDLAYAIGALTGVIVGTPIVMVFFFAAKYIYGIHKQVEKIAREDFLTGLLNRREFFTRISSVATHNSQQTLLSRSGMLLIIDADNFKRINDSFGHISGDKALIAIANAIQGATRSQDVVSRIGGEEFGVLVVDATHDIGAAVAAKILAAVNAIDLTVENTELNLSVSIGAARIMPNMALALAMKAADTALYRAKQTGKNKVIFGGMPDALMQSGDASAVVSPLQKNDDSRAA